MWIMRHWYDQARRVLGDLSSNNRKQEKKAYLPVYKGMHALDTQLGMW